MKKLIILFILISLGLSASSQILPYFPPRTPIYGTSPKVIQDRDLRAIKSFWFPYTNSTTPVLTTIDSAGSNVQLLNNGNLAVSSGLGLGFRQYVPSSVLATTYQPLITSTTDLTFRDLTPTGDLILNQTSGKATFGYNYMALGVVNAGSAASMKNKFTSKGNTIGSLTGGSGLFMQGAASPNNTTSIRPEIAFYRGANANPEGGIREHTSSDLGFELFAGNGAVTPVIVAKGEYNAVKSYFAIPTGINFNVGDLTVNKAVYSDAQRNLTTTGTSDLITEGSTNLFYTSARSALKANLASPTFTGTPLTPLASTGTNTTQIASTSFVQQEILADRIVNTTTTALSSATLNSTYPNVKVGYKVICHLITGAPAIYTKATENGSSDVWLTTLVTTTP